MWLKGLSEIQATVFRSDENTVPSVLYIKIFLLQLLMLESNLSLWNYCQRFHLNSNTIFYDFKSFQGLCKKGIDSTIFFLNNVKSGHWGGPKQVSLLSGLTLEKCKGFPQGKRKLIGGHFHSRWIILLRWIIIVKISQNWCKNRWIKSGGLFIQN